MFLRKLLSDHSEYLGPIAQLGSSAWLANGLLNTAVQDIRRSWVQMAYRLSLCPKIPLGPCSVLGICQITVNSLNFSTNTSQRVWLYLWGYRGN